MGVPVLETAEGCIFSSNAITRFIARIRRDVGLYGDNLFEDGMIDSWVEFCTNELEVPLCTWTYSAQGIWEDVPGVTRKQSWMSSEFLKFWINTSERRHTLLDI